ncbi:hypothetical protein SKAU_G00037240 [Synaphobranchus kaupii]|uniref:Uncharacterized protein n=1 Tax=Synaphobranchus kaupii TaxID=118154 RepID=A0A9Q1JDS4_SYNKA|nr:hypothetical protein SKAU_G00037240 [Synaphobranchus kaupii]
METLRRRTPPMGATTSRALLSRIAASARLGEWNGSHPRFPNSWLYTFPPDRRGPASRHRAAGEREATRSNDALGAHRRNTPEAERSPIFKEVTSPCRDSYFSDACLP